MLMGHNLANHAKQRALALCYMTDRQGRINQGQTLASSIALAQVQNQGTFGITLWWFFI